jgi:hypothetical protein
VYAAVRDHRPDLVERHLSEFARSGVDFLMRAGETFSRRREEGTLSAPEPKANSVATFVDLNYSRHRFAL